VASELKPDPTQESRAPEAKRAPARAMMSGVPASPPEVRVETPAAAPASKPIVPPVPPKVPYTSAFTDREPDEVLADGTQVFNNYPFQVKQPDGSMKTVGVTLTYKPTDVAEIAPVALPALPKKN